MDVNTGRIMSQEEFESFRINSPKKAKNYVPVQNNPQLCPGKSGKEFKDCCFSKISHLNRKSEKCLVKT